MRFRRLDERHHRRVLFENGGNRGSLDVLSSCGRVDRGPQREGRKWIRARAQRRNKRSANRATRTLRRAWPFRGKHSNCVEPCQRGGSGFSCETPNSGSNKLKAVLASLSRGFTSWAGPPRITQPRTMRPTTSPSPKRLQDAQTGALSSPSVKFTPSIPVTVEKRQEDRGENVQPYTGRTASSPSMACSSEFLAMS